LEQLSVGVFCLQAAPDSPVTSDFAALTLRGTVHHSSSVQSTVGAQGAIAPLAHRKVWCTPDNLVNYSGARLVNYREWLVRLRLGLVHWTLSGAPFFSTL
jgi:hypothetical protein